MQKVYLLLRNNRQTGPYSLEELLQLNLKPFDLVWVDGRSAAWQYPSEIPSLRPFVPETPRADAPFQPIATSAMEENPFQNGERVPAQPRSTTQKTGEAKRVFVSVPKTYNPGAKQSIEAEQSPYAPKPQPAYESKEEVKTTTPSFSESTHSYQQQKPVEEEVHTHYSRSLDDVEEDYTNWMYHEKTKKKTSVNTKDLVLAALILAVIGGSYYMISKPSVVNSVLPSNKAITQTIQQPDEASPSSNGSGDLVSSGQNQFPPSNDISASEPKSKIIKRKNPQIVSKAGTNASVPTVQNPMPGEKTNSNIPNDDIVVTEPEIKSQPKETATPEKKKKFGEVLKGIFTKKEKKQDAKTEETVMETPKSSNNRQATRRDDEANSSDNNTISNEINTASLMEQIEISSNAPDNWMLGIRNLKITLKNRSNVTIQAASVTVNYYNENNQLLEKKLVYFSNVAPNAKATAPAPDHKFADHVDLRLASATAKEERYASSP